MLLNPSGLQGPEIRTRTRMQAQLLVVQADVSRFTIHLDTWQCPFKSIGESGLVLREWGANQLITLMGANTPSGPKIVTLT